MALKIEDRVKEVFSGIYPLPENAKSTLEIKSMNLDSLDYVDLVQNLEEEFNIKIDDAIAPKWKTLGDIFQYIETNAPKE